jgi:hypothetical protein
MRRNLVASILFLCPVSVLAADWTLRQTDRPFDADELAALPGQSFVFYDDGEAAFGANGAYSYTYSAANGGGTRWGSYNVAPDGSVCIDFVNGFSRCDLYVHSGNRVVLITETGERYPVR